MQLQERGQHNLAPLLSHDALSNGKIMLMNLIIIITITIEEDESDILSLLEAINNCDENEIQCEDYRTKKRGIKSEGKEEERER